MTTCMAAWMIRSGSQVKVKLVHQHHFPPSFFRMKSVRFAWFVDLWLVERVAYHTSSLRVCWCYDVRSSNFQSQSVADVEKHQFSSASSTILLWHHEICLVKLLRTGKQRYVCNMHVTMISLENYRFCGKLENDNKFRIQTACTYVHYSDYADIHSCLLVNTKRFI